MIFIFLIVYNLLQGKGNSHHKGMRYTIPNRNYIIHTF